MKKIYSKPRFDLIAMDGAAAVLCASDNLSGTRIKPDNIRVDDLQNGFTGFEDDCFSLGF